MGKVVISENVSLDGVVEDPTGDAAPRTAAGSTGLAKNGRKSSSTKRSAPRPCYWVVGPTSTSERDGRPGAASGRKG
jgi:hypothetical protein